MGAVFDTGLAGADSRPRVGLAALAIGLAGLGGLLLLPVPCPVIAVLQRRGLFVMVNDFGQAARVGFVAGVATALWVWLEWTPPLRALCAQGLSALWVERTVHTVGV